MSKPQKVSVSRARRELAALVIRVAYKNESVVLTSYGKPVAKLIPCPAEGNQGDRN